MIRPLRAGPISLQKTTTMKLRSSHRLAWLLGIVALCGCVTEPVSDDSVKRREVDAYTLDSAGRRAGGSDEAPLYPPGLIAPRGDVSSSISPYHRFSHQTIRAPDGRLTRMYWLRAGRGKQTLELIQAHTRAYAENEESPVALTLVEKAQVDPRPAVAPKGVLATMITGVDAISDLITVTAEEDILLEVDQFLSAL